MIRTFVQKDLQYVIEAHIRIYRNEYNYDHSFTEFITHGARRLYQSVGFEVKEVRKQMLSGQELTEEQWELVL
ncbi:hypothetical protein [Paenibacillus xylanexedens]|uniref:RNA polymerase sigma-70 region 2 domain-containing protein n=1 Tax=Paenibacillus xylanexedens TaxID=528191 RepID=A0ABS4RQN4_PAEXY|nr:hypothetical protein [Paenibacillus xylanexedens]MBP2244112.1 hypothetical protein [Paenibacillus xylanexedens]